MATPVYVVRQDLVEAAVGVTRLTELSDYDNDGIEDQGVVDRAACEAEGLVNSYVRKVHEVPIAAPVPEIIRSTVANMTIYTLKSRRPGGLTPQDETLQEQRLEWLDKVAKGIVTLGINPSPAKSPLNSPKNTPRPKSKAVSRKNLEGYT